MKNLFTAILFFSFLFLILITNSFAQHWATGAGNIATGIDGVTTSNNFIGTASTNAVDLKIGTAGNDNIHIANSSGNIGIGTITPLAQLHVVGQNSITAVGWRDAVLISHTGALIFSDDSVSGNRFYFIGHPSSSDTGDTWHGLVPNIDGSSSPQYVYRNYGRSRTNKPTQGVHEFFTKVLADTLVGVKTLFPTRMVEVYDSLASQLRLTSSLTNATIPTPRKYTDFQTTSFGDLVIDPEDVNNLVATGRYVGIHAVNPKNTLEISSNAASPYYLGGPGSASGLTFTNMSSSSTVNASSNSSNTVLSVDSAGNVILVDDVGFGALTADNGLTASTPTNVQLGGTLIQTTDIDLSGYDLSFSGNTSPGVNRLSIGTTTPFLDTKVSAYNEKEDIGVQITSEAKGTNDLGYNVGLMVNAYRGQSLNYGIIANAGNSGETNTDDIGITGNATTAYQIYGNAVGGDFYATYPGDNHVYSLIGCRGEASGTTDYAEGGYFIGTGGTIDNIGVYAEAYINSTDTSVANNNWAGWFAGSICTNQIFLPSDSALKTNIHPVNNAMSLINQLNPKYYNYQCSLYPHMNLPMGNQAGLVAQDVAQVIPAAVRASVQPERKDSSGNVISARVDFKAINYNYFIPLLIAAVKQLDSTNQSLQSQLSDLQNCCNQNHSEERKANTDSHVSNQTDVVLSDLNAVILRQNVPNPFAEQTKIGYVIPENAGFAQIIFFDQLGRILKTVDITSKGEGQLNVFAPDLSSGIYNYTLVVDGKIIDHKNMVKMK